MNERLLGIDRLSAEAYLVRLFQNGGLYRAYLHRLSALSVEAPSFSDRFTAFLHDRFGACHFLKPVLDRDPAAFATNGDDEVLQRYWAAEHGLPRAVSLEQILLAQIEEHRTEVLYNLDPMRYGSAFVRKLPGCVRKTLAWRAAPSPGADFGAYGAVVCNFPTILETYRQLGWRAEYFSPAYDPEMDPYAANNDRPIDILFVGSYSRHHRQRALVLHALAGLHDRFHVVFRLDRSKLTRLAESPAGHWLPIRAHVRPADVVALSQGPVFGRDLYAAMSTAKVVVNAAVDMAGTDRGNMRCFEAVGCGALMVSDRGNYPAGFADGKTMMLFQSVDDAATVVEKALRDWDRSRLLAAEGHRMLETDYGKVRQWKDFEDLVDRL